MTFFPGRKLLYKRALIQNLCTYTPFLSEYYLIARVQNTCCNKARKFYWIPHTRWCIFSAMFTSLTGLVTTFLHFLAFVLQPHNITTLKYFIKKYNFRGLPKKNLIVQYGFSTTINSSTLYSIHTEKKTLIQ